MLGISSFSLAPGGFVVFALLPGILGDCEPPPKLSNAVPRENTDDKNFPPGTSVVYKCLPDFYNVHAKVDVVTCLPHSQWSPMEDFCERSCHSPPRRRFAQIKEGQLKDYYTAMTTVAYICRQGYDTIPGINPVVTCLENYTWTPVPVFCKGKSCGDPGKPEHGDTVILTDLLYLAKVNFICENGYRLIGASTAKCQLKENEVEWNAKPPECQWQIVKPAADNTTNVPGQTVKPTRSYYLNTSGDCNYPLVRHATLRSGDPKDSYPVGTVLNYRCIVGYEHIPRVNPSLTCLDNSSWSIENPRFCQGRRCRPPTLENGKIVKSNDFRLGDEIIFGCDEGYRLIGRKNVQCIVIGTSVDWNRDPPFCQRIPCYSPPDIDNGKHSGQDRDDYEYGSAVTYTCNRGLSLIGTRTLSCVIAENGVDGKWSAPAPECKVVACRRPEIENGRMTTSYQPSYTYESAVMFECDHGYTLVGVNYVKCGADSTWQPALPRCVKGIFTTTVATVHPDRDDKNTTTAGPTIGSTTEPSEETPNPETGSTRSPETQPPRDDTGSNSSTAIIVGSVVAVLLGVGAIAAIWKCRSFFIKGKTDPHPSPPESYHAVSTHTDVALESKPISARFTNLLFIALIGTRAMIYACMFTLLWGSAGLLPIALGAAGSCGPPTRLDFAEITDEYKEKNSFPVGSTVKYMCRPGYTRRPGQKYSSTCLESQEWSEVLELCTKKSCGHPGEPENGRLIVPKDLLLGSTVNYICEEGHRLIGKSSSRRCVISDRRVAWTGDIPFCQRIPCYPPPDIPHGQHSGRYMEEFSYGTAVTYTCKKGYPLVGNASIYCTTEDGLNGIWHGRAYCGVTQCPPPQVKNGRIATGHSDTYMYNQRVIFDCNADHKIAGSREVRCQVDGTWDPPLPHCEQGNPDIQKEKRAKWFVDADSQDYLKESFTGCAYPKIQNGRIRNAQGQIKPTETVIFECDPGYILKGNHTVQCQFDGTWDSPVPICVRVVQCQPPPYVQNGMHDNQEEALFIDGMFVKYTCKPGYNLIGEGTIYCTASGTWSPSAPRCEVTGCAYPKIQNGRIRNAQGQIKPTETVIFECDPGYILKGNHTVQCQFDGTWDSPVPICVRVVQCQPPPYVQNGMHDNQEEALFIDGMFVKYTCKPGYNLIGEGTIYCTASGTWSPSAPRCEVTGCAYPKIQNGRIRNAQGQIKPTETVIFECDPGYILKGNHTVQCQFDGTWDSPVPICVRGGSCGLPIKLEFAELADEYKEKKSFPVGSTVKYVCRPGYAKHPGLKASVMCIRNQEWSEVQEFCKRKSCGHPGEPDNGRLIAPEGILFGSTVNYTCDDGHRLVGQPTRQCVISGRRVAWTGDIPICLRISCSSPPDIPHGRHTGRYMNEFSYGTAVTYTCEKDYPLVGNASIYCTTEDGLNGIWYGHAHCGVQCPTPQMITNGKYSIQQSKGFTNGVFVEYSCHPGYDLVGDARIFCTASGSWNSSVPTCKVIQCPSPPKVQHGKYSTLGTAQYISGKSVKYSCDPGYVLIGEAIIYCTASGVWSLPVPCCEELQCQPPPNVQNGTHSNQESSVFTTGMFVKYTCEPGYSLTGQATIYCTTSGTWSPAAPHCEALQCPPPPPIPNGDHNSKGLAQFAIGRYVNYSCHRGYLLHGKAFSQCTTSGAWSQPLPHCEVMHCPLPPRTVHGKHIGENFTFGNSVIYICDAGYSLVGEHVVTLVKYEDPVAEHGIKLSGFQDSYAYDNNITFECKIGYFMIGSYFIRCEDNNTWVPKMPSCKKITPHLCGAPVIPSGKVEPLKPQYAIGSTIFVHCNPSCYFPDETIEMRVICQGYNLWDPPVQPCFYRTSRDIAELYISNGRIVHGLKKGYEPRDKIIIRCNAGYSLRGSDEIRYIGGNKWLPSVPSCSLSMYKVFSSYYLELSLSTGVGGNETRCCETRAPSLSLSSQLSVMQRSSWGLLWGRRFLGIVALVVVLSQVSQGKTCVPPDSPKDGSVISFNSEYIIGARIGYICIKGYRLIGRRSNHCILSGTEVRWQHQPARCMRVACKVPPDILDGSHNGTGKPYSYGIVIKYSCREAFSLIGEPSIVCDIDRYNRPLWSSKPPKCKVVTCTDPVVQDGIKLSDFKDSYTYGNNITFECKNGYFMIGSYFIQCVENDTWLPNVPSCKKISPDICGAPLILKGNVYPLQPQYESGIAIAVRCNPKYSFLDETIEMNIRCQGYNRWDPPVQPCFFRTSPDNTELDIPNGRIFSGEKKYYKPGDEVTIQCHAAYILKGSSKIKYIGGNKWSPNIPTCVLSFFIRILIVACLLPSVILATKAVYKKFCLQQRAGTQRRQTQESTSATNTVTLLPEKNEVTVAESEQTNPQENERQQEQLASPTQLNNDISSEQAKETAV
ncbi:complement receptor type 1 [Rhineura floridana]|uniref:complement receptor type 1 n=1 Tax=Rhineura floridana TaxID=261503 RepID=UPI002AC85751|nr:complement receptor type 1 [Rhineura floridana]